MKWLEDLNKERCFFYQREDGAIIEGTMDFFKEEFGLEIKGDPGEILVLGEEEFAFAGFSAVKLNQGTKIVYEQNGRKAYKIGKETYLSATKLNYMKTGETKSVYSKQYQSHLDSKYKETLNKHIKDQKNHERSITRGKVSMASDKEYTKNKVNKESV